MSGSTNDFGESYNNVNTLYIIKLALTMNRRKQLLLSVSRQRPNSSSYMCAYRFDKFSEQWFSFVVCNWYSQNFLSQSSNIWNGQALSRYVTGVVSSVVVRHVTESSLFEDEMSIATNAHFRCELHISIVLDHILQTTANYKQLMERKQLA